VCGGWADPDDGCAGIAFWATAIGLVWVALMAVAMLGG
jgi:hypothetical protein